MREGGLHARAEIELRHAFVLRADHVRKIWKTLKETIGNVQATASCADQMERTFSSVEALVAYENPRTRQIVRLDFSAWAPDRQREAYLRLGGAFSPITLQIVGREPMVSRTKDTLADILDGIRPWYSWFARVDLSTAVWGGVLFIYFVWSVSGRAQSGGSIENVPFWIAFLAITTVLAGLAVTYTISWALSKLQKRFFPVGTFAIGQGQERYRVDEQWRWGALISLGISTVGSIIAGMLFLLAGWGGSA